MKFLHYFWTLFLVAAAKEENTVLGLESIDQVNNPECISNIESRYASENYPNFHMGEVGNFTCVYCTMLDHRNVKSFGLMRKGHDGTKEDMKVCVRRRGDLFNVLDVTPGIGRVGSRDCENTYDSLMINKTAVFKVPNFEMKKTGNYSCALWAGNTTHGWTDSVTQVIQVQQLLDAPVTNPGDIDNVDKSTCSHAINIDYTSDNYPDFYLKEQGIFTCDFCMMYDHRQFKSLGLIRKGHDGVNEELKVCTKRRGDLEIIDVTPGIGRVSTRACTTAYNDLKINNTATFTVANFEMRKAGNYSCAIWVGNITHQWTDSVTDIVQVQQLLEIVHTTTTETTKMAPTSDSGKSEKVNLCSNIASSDYTSDNYPDFYFQELGTFTCQFCTAYDHRDLQSFGLIRKGHDGVKEDLKACIKIRGDIYNALEAIRGIGRVSRRDCENTFDGLQFNKSAVFKVPNFEMKKTGNYSCALWMANATHQWMDSVIQVIQVQQLLGKLDTTKNIAAEFSTTTTTTKAPGTSRKINQKTSDPTTPANVQTTIPASRKTSDINAFTPPGCSSIVMTIRPEGRLYIEDVVDVTCRCENNNVGREFLYFIEMSEFWEFNGTFKGDKKFQGQYISCCDKSSPQCTATTSNNQGPRERRYFSYLKSLATEVELYGESEICCNSYIDYYVEIGGGITYLWTKNGETFADNAVDCITVYPGIASPEKYECTASTLDVKLKDVTIPFIIFKNNTVAAGRSKLDPGKSSTRVRNTVLITVFSVLGVGSIITALVVAKKYNKFGAIP